MKSTVSLDVWSTVKCAAVSRILFREIKLRLQMLPGKKKQTKNRTSSLSPVLLQDDSQLEDKWRGVYQLHIFFYPFIQKNLGKYFP